MLWLSESHSISHGNYKLAIGTAHKHHQKFFISEAVKPVPALDFRQAKTSTAYYPQMYAPPAGEELEWGHHEYQCHIETVYLVS